MRLLVLILFVVTTATDSVRAQSTDWCVPSDAVRTALDNLPVQSAGESDWAFRVRSLSALRNLLTRFPGDTFVARNYINAMWRPADRVAVTAEYRTNYEKNPNDGKLAYLLGLTLVGLKSAEATRLFHAALAGEPQFQWPHVDLARIYASPAFEDQAARVRHLQSFLSACPSNFGVYGNLTTLSDKKLLASFAVQLRRLIEARSDLPAIGAYQTLWTLEFKAHPMSDYDVLRNHVSEDLKRIRKLALEDKRPWYFTLEAGYKLINDQKQSDWASEERQRRLPSRWEYSAMAKWIKDHPRPKGDDPAGQKKDYYTVLLKKTDEWLHERPNLNSALYYRLSAVDNLDDLPEVQVAAAGDAYLKGAAEDAGPEGPSSGYYFEVARVLVKRHLLPERVVQLVSDGLAQMEIEFSRPANDLYTTKKNLEESNFWRKLDWLQADSLQARAYLDLKQGQNARLALARFEDRLESAKALIGENPAFRKAYTGRLSGWWALMARAAELEGHEHDAMAYYQNALLAQLENGTVPHPGTRDDLAADARRLWIKLGGTTDGWQIWYGRRADVLAGRVTLSWESASEPLPAFDLKDLHGQTWNLASLKGKVAFLNFWASW